MTPDQTTRDGTVISRYRRRWQHSTVLKPRLISIGHLLSGNGANVAITAISTAIAARSIGVQAFGVFALVLSIGRVCERLIRFESWQPLIRFAAQPDVESDKRRLSELFLAGLLLDVGSALVAALLTVVCGYLLMPVLHLEMRYLPLVCIYAAAIAINIRGMPTASLRLNGKFRLLAYVQLISSLIQIIMSVVAMWMGLGLMAFVVIWTVCQMIDSSLFLWLGFRTLKHLCIPSPLRSQWRGLMAKFPGFIRFALSTNISSTLRTLTQEADTILVGAIVGTSSAGMYHIAKRFAKIAQQIGQQIQTVIYPDMARFWAKADLVAFRNITARVQVALGAVGLGILGLTVISGKFLIDLAFGEEFAATYPLLMTQLVAVVLIMHAAPSRSALLAMNRPGFVMAVAVFSTMLFFAVAFAAMPTYGAIGANYAHIAFAALSAVAMDIAWWSETGMRLKRSRLA
ncbi:lipopolysaccharide biosynthesis protein [Novosphingobium lentum]|uniref:lipopolysaccharide biosynthesis protein n=1 Tax=Novosphingobium lentum TaxID=145287 RepID=UPI000829DC18|nr:oligosaccharide flippase family protein [Novosphingobium lentum]